VVALDALGQPRHVHLDRGLHGGVLVLGVDTRKSTRPSTRPARAWRPTRSAGSTRPASRVVENSSERMALWMSR
jgi:hypothetical protein